MVLLQIQTEKFKIIALLRYMIFWEWEKIAYVRESLTSIFLISSGKNSDIIKAYSISFQKARINVLKGLFKALFRVNGMGSDDYYNFRDFFWLSFLTLLTEFHNKNCEFLLIANFWASGDLSATPGIFFSILGNII